MFILHERKNMGMVFMEWVNQNSEHRVQWNSVQFSHSVVSNSATPWTAARQASLSITNSRSPPKSMSIESMMPSNHLILCRPLLLLPSIFPSIGSFQMSQLFTSGGQSIGVSASTSLCLTSKNSSESLVLFLFSRSFRRFSAISKTEIRAFTLFFMWNFTGGSAIIYDICNP